MPAIAPDLLETMRGLITDEDLARLGGLEVLADEEILGLVDRVTAVADRGGDLVAQTVEVADAVLAEARRRGGLIASALDNAEAASQSQVDLAPPRATTRVPLSLIAARQPASTRPLAGEPSRTLPAMIASAGGVPLDGIHSVADELAKAMGRLPDAQEGRHVVASWKTNYPNAQTLGQSPDLDQIRALIASGGLCAPTTVRYELETVSDAGRPLRAGLPSFNADRGGIQYNSPAHLVDVLADQSSAALTTVTVAQDAAATTKTVQEVACGSLQTVQVRAIANRLQFSNFADRYQPERMRQWIMLSTAAHSRLCERQLFEDMQTVSTLVNGGTLWVSATRQWVNNVLVAARAMRYRHRMKDDYPIRIVLPRWFQTMVACDLVLQAPGDGTVLGQFDAEQVIDRWLLVENIRPIWHVDDARTNNALGAGAPPFTSQTGSGATLQDFPGRMVSLMFPEGSFLFLDGGSLDFGIIRDSALNQSNRFQTFMEVFEAVAFVGVESIAIETQVCASGQGIAGTTTTKCGGVGS